MTKEQEFRKQTEEGKFKAFSLMCEKVAELERDLDYQKQARTIAENAVVDLQKENAELKKRLVFARAEFQRQYKENAELKKKLKGELKTLADKDLSFVAKFDALERENAELREKLALRKYAD